MPDEPTRGEILADPDAFTVEQVLAAFADSTPEEVAAAKALEAAGKDRVGIRDWLPPAPSAESSSVPVFSRERILGEDGARLLGVQSWVIAGALAGNDQQTFTRDEAQFLVDGYLGRAVHTDGQAAV